MWAITVPGSPADYPSAPGVGGDAADEFVETAPSKQDRVVLVADNHLEAHQRIALSNAWGREMTMKAAVLEAPYRFRIEERPLPALRPGWALLKVKGAGLCGSDLHFYRGVLQAPPGLVRGHEIAGVIADAGDTGLPLGQAAVVCPMIGCGACRACQRGEYHICENLKMIGSGDFPGGFAEYVAVPKEKLYPVDSGVLPFAHAALADCVGVGLHAANVIQLRPGEATTILGDGAIALFLLQFCVARGAKPVIVVGKHERNLEFARQFGADLTLDARREDLVSAVLNFSGHQDVVFEAAGGHIPPYETALRMLRRGGRVGLLGLTGETQVLVPWKDMVVFEQALVGMMGYSTFDGVDELRQTIDMMVSGEVRIPPEMITRIKLEDIGQGFQMMVDRARSGVIKVVIDWEKA